MSSTRSGDYWAFDDVINADDASWIYDSITTVQQEAPLSGTTIASGTIGDISRATYPFWTSQVTAQSNPTGPDTWGRLMAEWKHESDAYDRRKRLALPAGF